MLWAHYKREEQEASFRTPVFHLRPQILTYAMATLHYALTEQLSTS